MIKKLKSIIKKPSLMQVLPSIQENAFNNNTLT